MTQDQSKATEILINLVTKLEPKLRNMVDWYSSTVTTIDKWYKAEGNQGIRRAKDILNQGWLSILGEPTQTLDYVKSSCGIPDLVKPLVDRVKRLPKTARLLSATLSLIRVTDLWQGKLQDSTVLSSVEVIQNSRIPSSAEKTIQDISGFVLQFLQRFPDHIISKRWNDRIKISDRSYYKESKGPNGSLTAMAHRDVKSLCEAVCEDGENLFSHIQKLQDELIKHDKFSFHSQDLTRFREALQSWSGYEDMNVSECPGKISIIPEKSGKVRLVAQPDYFTQVTLAPVHDWLTNVLYAFEADCTKDQRSAIPKIQNWQSQGKLIYSFDQSSCTDLFPFKLQLELLKIRFGEAVSESVRTVMSDRDWKLKLPSGATRKIRWSVGQPMGCLASWPLMALTHHFLVQYCYWRSSGKDFARIKSPYNRYVICGDDIVIADRNVADTYYKVVTSLGMKVNKAKSHITGGSSGIDPVSEFAKITLWKGQPLYPIRPNMILSSVKDWRYAVPLFIDITDGGFHAKKSTIESAIRKYYPAGQRFLIPLLSIPSELGGVGFRDSVSLKDKFTSLETNRLHPWLIYLGHRIRQGLKKDAVVLECSLTDSLPASVEAEHPLVRYTRTENRNLAPAIYLTCYRIPSVREICEEMLREGLGVYKRYIFNPTDAKVPPHLRPESKESQLKALTSWERALRRDIYVKDPNPLTMLMESTEYYESTNVLAECQYKVISNTLSIFGLIRSDTYSYV